MRNLFVEDVTMQLSKGKISRRQFVMAALAAGLTLPVALSMATKTLAAIAKPGGKLRLGLAHGATTDTLDPSILNNGFLQDVAYGFANCLTEIDQQGSVIPELAESFESTADAKTWTFRIRKNVEFHNGKSLNANDVAASINFHRGPESKSEAGVLVQQIVEIKVLDSNTIQFTLAAGNADFPFLVADHHLIVLPSDEGKIDWSAKIGSGPYQLTAFEPGVRAAGKRNNNYFKQDRAHFDEVEWLSLIDATARQNALAGGSVDVIDQVPTATIDLLKEDGKIRILEVNGMLHYTFPMWMLTPPFDNKDVRLALKLAVNRQELLDKILLGHGSLGNDHPISPVHRYYAGDIDQRKFDPDKAKWHVEQSGLGKLVVDLHASDAAFPGAVDAAVLISEQAKKAGITINVIREANDGYWANVSVVR